MSCLRGGERRGKREKAIEDICTAQPPATACISALTPESLKASIVVVSVPESNAQHIIERSTIATMTSAADRIPNEIWEIILVQSQLTTRELFRLQCVSRRVLQTINGSTPLLRTMEILHKPIEEKKHRIPNPVLWTSHLELRPYTYRIEVLSPASPRNDGERWKVNINVALNFATEARVLHSKTAFGIKSNKHCFGIVLDGTWRRMKIARFPVEIDVLMHVSYLSTSYEEKLSDPTGQMTLGDLASLLEAVHARSEEEHLRVAHDFHASDGQQQTTTVVASQCGVS